MSVIWADEHQKIHLMFNWIRINLDKPKVRAKRKTNGRDQATRGAREPNGNGIGNRTVKPSIAWVKTELAEHTTQKRFSVQ